MEDMSPCRSRRTGEKCISIPGCINGKYMLDTDTREIFTLLCWQEDITVWEAEHDWEFLSERGDWRIRTTPCRHFPHLTGQYRQTSGTSISTYNIRTVTYNIYIWTLQSAWRKSCGPGDQNWANRVLLLEGLIVRVGDCHHVTLSFQLTLLNIFVFALNM